MFNSRLSLIVLAVTIRLLGLRLRSPQRCAEFLMPAYSPCRAYLLSLPAPKVRTRHATSTRGSKHIVKASKHGLLHEMMRLTLQLLSLFRVAYLLVQQ